MRILALLFLFNIGQAWAFQCDPEASYANSLKEAQRAFLIYVTDLRLEEELKREIFSGYPAADDESSKLLSAGYRVLEDFKGDPTYKPRLLDLLGIGTGYAGLTPGIYYVVFLRKSELPENFGYQLVTMCDVQFSHYRKDAEDFLKAVSEIRAAARTSISH